MKIGQPAELPVALRRPALAHPAKGASAKSPTGATAAARQQAASLTMTLPSSTSAMQQASRSEAADVEMELVDALRAAIADGSFQVNAQVIADKLLANAQEMLTRSNH